MTHALRPLVDFAELTEIELFVRRRMQEYELGEHASVFRGPGADFVGLRDWQAGDRLSSIDWPQSTLTNFSPMVIREYEQAGAGPIVVVADRSASTRCGTGGLPIAAGIARVTATIGLSAAYAQDPFGLIAFQGPADPIEAVRPRVGRGQVVHCLDAYQGLVPMEPVRPAGTLAATIAGRLRRPALVPVVSDFLFAGAPTLIRQLAELGAVHDVFLVIVDASFSVQLPDVSCGWIRAWDVETRQSRLMSRREWRALARRVQDWQQDVYERAREADLDVVRLEMDPAVSQPVLAEFVLSRKLRKG